MDREYKKLTGTTILFAGANIVSKLLKILLVPLYTYYLTTSEFGTAETVVITVNLLYPVFLLGVSEAAIRFTMKEDSSKEGVISNCFAIVLIMSVAGSLALIPLAYFQVFKGHLAAMYVMTVAAAFEALMMAEAKGVGKNNVFAASEIVSAVALIVSNVVLLAVLKSGIGGYLWSMAISSAARIIYLSLRLKVFHMLKMRFVKKGIITSILKFSLPFMPATVLWWIMDSSGRYFVMWFVGASAAGLYAVAFRLSALLTSLAAVFHQAWTLSAIRRYNRDDFETFYRSAMKAYTALFFLAAAVLIAFVKPVMRLLDDSYNDAWKYAPALIIAAVFFALSGLANANYAVCEKTAGALWTALAGAAVAVIAGAILTPAFGMHGAAVSSGLAFYSLWLIMTIHTGRLIGIRHDYLLVHLNLLIIAAETFAVLKQLSPLATFACIVALLLVNRNTIGKINDLLH